MKVLDTTFLVDLIRGKKETLSVIETKEDLLTTQVNMYELIIGLFLKNISSSKIMKVVDMFGEIKLLSLDDNSIIKSAEISSELTKKGEFVCDCDCMTAGIALSRGINKIVTRNTEHFKRIKGIKVETY